MTTETKSERTASREDKLSEQTDTSVDIDVLLRIGSHLVLIVMSAIMVGPFVWAILTSLKPPGQIFTTVHQLIPADPTLQNYVRVWIENPFDRWLLNSFVITVGAVFFTVVFDSLAGFALAKGDFRGRRFLYTLVISLLIIPPPILLVPLYLEMQMIGWHNTYWAIIVLYVANPFGAFMMRQFFLSIPDEVIEAARMDGCNLFQIYLRIMLPMAKSSLSSLAVFTFVFTWGAFLWPLVITDDTAMFPLQVGIGLLSGPYGGQWGALLAASMLAALPVLIAYLLAQRTFMEGIALSGRKG